MITVEIWCKRGLGPKGEEILPVLAWRGSMPTIPRAGEWVQIWPGGVAIRVLDVIIGAASEPNAVLQVGADTSGQYLAMAIEKGWMKGPGEISP